MLLAYEASASIATSAARWERHGATLRRLRCCATGFRRALFDRRRREDAVCLFSLDKELVQYFDTVRCATPRRGSRPGWRLEVSAMPFARLDLGDCCRTGRNRPGWKPLCYPSKAPYRGDPCGHSPSRTGRAFCCRCSGSAAFDRTAPRATPFFGAPALMAQGAEPSSGLPSCRRIPRAAAGSRPSLRT
jgi:hypothetical protein